MTGPSPLLSGIVANFRDTGGMRTTEGNRLRLGRLMRSSALVRLGPRERQAVVAAAPTACYFDLRTDLEVDRDGGMEPWAEHGWTWERLPVEDEPRYAAPVEVADFNTQATAQYLAAARGIAARISVERPAIVACSLGKDRTGIVVALLLAALGVDRKEIAADFDASAPSLASQRHLLPDRWRYGHLTRVATGRDCLDLVDRAEALSRADGRGLDVRRVARLVFTDDPCRGVALD